MRKRKQEGYITTQEQKDKTAKSVLLYLSTHPKIKFNILNHPPKPKSCANCGNLHIRNGKTCSDSCKFTLQRLGAIKGGKKSAKARVIRSKDEKKLSDLLSVNTTILSNHVIADGWDADIFIPSLNVAIFWNGPWHYKEMGIKGHSLKQVQTRDKIKTSLFESLGIKVIAFEDRYFTPQTAYDSLKRALDLH